MYILLAKSVKAVHDCYVPQFTGWLFVRPVAFFLTSPVI